MKTLNRIFVLALAISGCGGGGPGGFGGNGPTADGNGTDLSIVSTSDLATSTPSGDLAGADLAGADLAMPTGPQTIAAGMFIKGQQNGGDTGRGSASLVRAADGTITAVFGADFQSTPVPAGEVVLTSRSSIGTGGIAAGDLDLGPLHSASGAQQYTLTAADGGRRNLFVYCVTYGIDVAIAHLQ